MLDHDNATVAREVISAWNARDLSRYIALLSDDCIVESCHEAPAGSHTAARTMIQRYLAEIPDLWFDIMQVVATEHNAMVSWRARGTRWDDTSLADTIRKPADVFGCTVMGIERGRIVRLWHYWDTDELCRRRTTREPKNRKCRRWAS